MINYRSVFHQHYGKMNHTELSGSVKALLGEYKRAINELIAVISMLNEDSLTMIVDPVTTDPDCRSIQTILTHVVYSGYGYTYSIENSLGADKTRPGKKILNDANEYSLHLQHMFDYCENFFRNNPTLEIEQTDQTKKIMVAWGQQYDIEQLLEHAIVHILRHRRQIENFIRIQAGNSIDTK
jgi:uncharacterized damage-inducible protein DinB